MLQKSESVYKMKFISVSTDDTMGPTNDSKLYGFQYLCNTSKFIVFDFWFERTEYLTINLILKLK